jgi:hypothetical protein
VTICQDIRTPRKALNTLSAPPPENLSNLQQQAEAYRSNPRRGCDVQDPQVRMSAVGYGRGGLPLSSSEAIANSTLAQHHTCADTHESGRPARASGIIPLECTLMTPRSQPPRNGTLRKKFCVACSRCHSNFFSLETREREFPSAAHPKTPALQNGV